MIRSQFNECKDPGSPVAVIGDGWAALGAVSFLTEASIPVVWIQASGARILPPLPSLAHGPGVAAWRTLAQALRIEAGDEQSGCWLREFRNKAFREPLWTQAPTLPTRLEVMKETLWSPEQAFVGAFDAR